MPLSCGTSIQPTSKQVSSRTMTVGADPEGDDTSQLQLAALTQLIHVRTRVDIVSFERSYSLNMFMY